MGLKTITMEILQPTDTLRTLVSSGASNFSADHRVETIPADALITPKTYDHWKKWKNRLDSSDDSSTWINQLDNPDERLQDIQDTVGAVAWHRSDGLAAGVSRLVCIMTFGNLNKCKLNFL